MTDEYTASVESVDQPPEHILRVLNRDFKPLVTVLHDGTIEYGENYSPDGAAHTFWSQMSKVYYDYFDFSPQITGIVYDVAAFVLDSILMSEEPVELNDAVNAWFKQNGIDSSKRDHKWKEKLCKSAAEEE